MAVVTHLAVHRWAVRQPKGIAKDLSIDVEDVALVLKSFKGLFRESAGTSKDHGDHFYALHLRFARQVADEDNNKDRPPLENEYLKQLLDFVAQRASEELQRGAAMKGALITASLSLIASLTSVGVALMSVH
jgi:hypothetical protein